MGQAIRIREVGGEERRTIERLARSRTAAARLVERAQILRLAVQGQRVPASARAVRVGQETARFRLERFDAAGRGSLSDAPRSGRPPTYTPEQVGEVVAAALTGPQAPGMPVGCWTLDRLGG